MLNSNPVATTMIKGSGTQNEPDLEAFDLSSSNRFAAVSVDPIAPRHFVCSCISCAEMRVAYTSRLDWRLHSVKRIMRYLRGTMNTGFFLRTPQGDLVGFSNTDWDETGIPSAQRRDSRYSWDLRPSHGEIKDSGQSSCRHQKRNSQLSAKHLRKQSGCAR